MLIVNIGENKRRKRKNHLTAKQLKNVKATGKKVIIFNSIDLLSWAVLFTVFSNRVMEVSNCFY